MNWKLLLLLSSVVLSGCALFGEKVVVRQHNLYLPIVCPNPPQPTPIKAQKIEPRGIIDKSGTAWVGLTPQHYQNLSINTQETIRYIKNQRGNIRYYRTCIVDFNESIDKLKDEQKSANATE